MEKRKSSFDCVQLTNYQSTNLVTTDQVNYDPSGSCSSLPSSTSANLVDTGVPIKSTANHQYNKTDRKPLLIGDESTKGSLLSTGRHLLDGSAFSHRSILNLYHEYKSSEDKSISHKFSILPVILASVMWIGCWCSVLFFPLLMVIFGIIYRDQCPGIPQLAGLLIFMGIVSTINNIVNVMDHVRHLYLAENDNAIVDPTGSSHLSSFSLFLNIVTVILIVWLSVVVLKHPEVNSDQPDSLFFCSSVIYNFASWIVYLIGCLCVVIFVAILIGCCLIICLPSRCSS